jgi:hypothetical protein
MRVVNPGKNCVRRRDKKEAPLDEGSGCIQALLVVMGPSSLPECRVQLLQYPHVKLILACLLIGT